MPILYRNVSLRLTSHRQNNPAETHARSARNDPPKTDRRHAVSARLSLAGQQPAPAKLYGVAPAAERRLPNTHRPPKTCPPTPHALSVSGRSNNRLQDSERRTSNWRRTMRCREPLRAAPGRHAGCSPQTRRAAAAPRSAAPPRSLSLSRVRQRSRHHAGASPAARIRLFTSASRWPHCQSRDWGVSRPPMNRQAAMTMNHRGGGARDKGRQGPGRAI